MRNLLLITAISFLSFFAVSNTASANSEINNVKNAYIDISGNSNVVSTLELSFWTRPKTHKSYRKAKRRGNRNSLFSFKRSGPKVHKSYRKSQRGSNRRLFGFSDGRKIRRAANKRWLANLGVCSAYR